jgi:hypothetical protein
MTIKTSDKRTRVPVLPRLMAAAAVASVACGCAMQGAGAGGSARASATLDCLLNRNLRQYTLLDDRNLIIYGSGLPYHVVLSSAAIDLRGEIAIGVLDRDQNGRICPYGGDSILIDGPLFERIPISSIERIDDAQVETLEIEFGVVESPEGQFIVTPLE